MTTTDPEVKLLLFAELAYCSLNLRCRHRYDDLILHDFSSSPLRRIDFKICQFFQRIFTWHLKKLTQQLLQGIYLLKYCC